MYKQLSQVFTEAVTFLECMLHTTFVALKQMVDEYNSAGVADVKVTVDEMIPLGECYFRRGEIVLLDNDNQTIDTLK